ncbi:hypothetical protein [Coleofasciculus chthonoplastes]|uniref:hypothetical protein n=1 Tax=Coleofasciculus chthonoplastes TaxID=64178 RepID=UPI004063304D
MSRHRLAITPFLNCESLFLSEDIKSLLHHQFIRLSDIEKDVMSWLVNQPKPVSLSQLLDHLQLSPSAVLNAMQSLARRSLIEKQEQDHQTLFSVAPGVKQYVKTQPSPS